MCRIWKAYWYGESVFWCLKRVPLVTSLQIPLFFFPPLDVQCHHNYGSQNQTGELGTTPTAEWGCQNQQAQKETVCQEMLLNGWPPYSLLQPKTSIRTGLDGRWGRSLAEIAVTCWNPGARNTRVCGYLQHWNYAPLLSLWTRRVARTEDPCQH